VDEKFPRGFTDIEGVLKESEDGFQYLTVKGVYTAFLKNLRQKHFAHGCRELINQAPEPKVLVSDDPLGHVKNTAHLNGDLRLPVGGREFLHLPAYRAYADEGVHHQLAPQGVFHCRGQDPDAR
jgi:hypothetical protein